MLSVFSAAPNLSNVKIKRAVAQIDFILHS